MHYSRLGVRQRHRLLQAVSGAMSAPMTPLTMLPGYADPSTGHFRAAVESADKLHRHRSPTDHLELRQQMSATQVQYLTVTCHNSSACSKQPLPLGQRLTFVSKRGKLPRCPDMKQVESVAKQALC